ncbi:hypothetical protein CKO42_02195 [Lamprobacter modestohalophilus]|uniref:Uncharacterized protein n=1 Tax=Lamprobacter modestohalophilus TaxID=1064514 RepID=A0A9X1B2G1_9GAMM|nr:hypothetical protein [Lamprobacter modestohalophilus]MBK1617280.1 hypothetical protein [Lamprobacter modestohalophilus]
MQACSRVRCATAAFLIAASAALSPIAAQADTVLDQIDAARRAYQAGEPGVATEALNVAIVQIQQQQTEKQLQLFPEPLPGWTADDATAEATGFIAALTGKVLSRTYRQTETGAEVMMTLSANSPFLGFISGLMQTPFFTQGAEGLGAYVHQGYRGLLEPQENGSAKLSLVIGNSILLQLEGSQGTDAEILEAYLSAMDLKALEQAFDN